MSLLEDVIKALERIPLWKRVSALPEEVESLRRRLEAVEAQLAGKTGPQCPLCEAPGFKRTSSKPDPVMGDLGVIQDTFQCPNCGHSEHRQRDTAS